MSNSSLVTYTNLTDKHYGERPAKGITIHCFVGQVTAKRGVDYLVSKPNASVNYVVGIDGIGLCVEEKFGAWTSSSKKNDYTDGMVTIETACDSAAPYLVRDDVMERLIDLCVDICQRNNIPKLVWSNNKADRVNKTNGCNVSFHRDFAATACPGDFLVDKIPNYIIHEVNKRLGNVIPVQEIKPMVKSNEDIAKEVIAGKWGNGADRKSRLTAAGYDYNTIQAIVNKLMNKQPEQTTTPVEKPNNTLEAVATIDEIVGLLNKLKTLL